MDMPLQKSRWAVAVCLLLAGVAAGLLLPTTAWLAGMQDGDGAMTALISTQKLTWYFWGQDRLLNLLPALAAPFHDPEFNLRVQVLLRAALAFLSPLGVLCIFNQSWRSALLITVLAQCLLAFALSPYGAFNFWVQHNPCGTGLVLFAVAIWVCQRQGAWHWLAGFAVLFVAYAVNLAMVLWSIPFLLVAMVFGVRNRLWLYRLIGSNFFAVLAAWAHGQRFGEAATKFTVNPSYKAVLAGYHSLFAEVDGRLLGGALAIAVVAAVMRRSRESLLALMVALGMVVAVGAISCLDWLQDNVYNIRYFLTFLTVFATCCAYLLVTVLPRRMLSLPAQVMASMLLGLAMFATALHGLSATPSALIDARWRARSELAARTAIDAHAAFIVGDFWDVWPAVMDARSKLYRSGRGNEPMYGLAFRGHVLRKRFDALFAAHPEGVLALCLQPDLGDCVKTANVFGQLTRPVVADTSSVKPLTLSGRTAYLVVLRPAG